MPEKDPAGTDAFVAEDARVADAREAAGRLGVEPVAPAVGAHLAVVAAAAAARTLLEIGTGTGVSGLWLLRGSPAAQLTTIDVDLDHQQVARHVFGEAGLPARQVRLIPGASADVLPRMNEDAYDVVLLDADPLTVAADLQVALGTARPGGSVLVPHALRDGAVRNPAKRDRATVAMREALRLVAAREDLIASLVEVGDGLLHVVRRPVPVS